MAKGEADTDAVNMSQLKALDTKVDTGATHYFSVNSDDSENPADTNWNNDGAAGKNSIAIGRNASTIGTGSIAIGDSAKIFNVNSQYALVIGEKAESAHGSIVIGRKAKDYDTDPKEAGSGIFIGEEAKKFRRCCPSRIRQLRTGQRTGIRRYRELVEGSCFSIIGGWRRCQGIGAKVLQLSVPAVLLNSIIPRLSVLIPMHGDTSLWQPEELVSLQAIIQ